MSVIDCFDCGEKFATPDLLQEHLWTEHILDRTEVGEDCPECDRQVSRPNATYHYPCFFEVEPHELGLFHDTSKQICPICDGLVKNKNIESHVQTHSITEWASSTDQGNECIICGLQIDNTTDHLICFLDAASRENSDKESSYSCPENGCDSRFSNKGRLLWHIWEMHLEKFDTGTSCPGCEKSIEIGSLTSHLACIDSFDESISKLLPPLDRTCFICDITVYDSSVLHRHFYQRHLTRRNECPSCGDDLTEAEGADITNHIGCIARITGETPMDWVDSEWPCPACGKIHNSQSSLDSHLEQQHLELIYDDLHCSECSKPISDSTPHLDCLLGERWSKESSSVTRHISPQRELDKNTYFNKLYEFVDRERNAERERHQKEYRESSIERLASQEKAIPELVYVGKQYHPNFDNQLVYEYPLDEDESPENKNNLVDEFGLYPYEIVLVGTSQHDTQLPQPGEITFIDEQTIGIAFPEISGNTNTPPLQNLCKDDRTYHAAKLLNPAPYNAEQEAIEAVQSGGLLLDAVLGDRVLSGTPLQLPIEATGQLNEYQKHAVERALGTEDVVCVHGPPGTGKTRTLTHLIRLAVAQDMRVLAASHSNQAVDNLIAGTSTPTEPDRTSLHYVGQPAGRGRFLPWELRDLDEDDEEGQQQATTYMNRPTEMSIARVGYNTDNKVVCQQYEGRPPREADVVAGTMGSLGGVDGDLGEFDLVVVDEAGQAAQPPTFIPASYSGTLVLVGDHLQLPPYVADEEAKEERMHISLFEHLLNMYGRDISALLRRQYRMNEQIVEFPNKHVYDNEIETASLNRDWRVDGLVPIMAVDASGGEETLPGSKSKRNPEEAGIVADHVKLLLNSGLEASEIGVITPYTAQIGTIHSAINEKLGTLSELKIATVDSFQGSEREAIVVSWVRSNNRNDTGFLSFPDEGMRRLNVAMTRARKRLVLIGDWNTLGTPGASENPENTCSKLFAALYYWMDESNLVKYM